MKRYSDYDNFAWLYNRDFTAYAEQVFPVLKDIAGDRLPRGAHVLDLCCGTGQPAKVLTEKGYRVTGIDGSEEMLRYARENAPKAEFIAADARNFRLPPVYDAAFSTFDSLNHILKAAELRRTFRNVCKCLVSGGVFVFDLNTEKHFKTFWKNWRDIKETPDYFYAVHSDYNPEKRLAPFQCTIFQRKSRGWQRSDIFLQETFYSNAEVKSLLKKAGFTQIRTYSISRERGLHKPNKGSSRIFYYALKP
jgi:SAM-dependent methyltransferase